MGMIGYFYRSGKDLFTEIQKETTSVSQLIYHEEDGLSKFALDVDKAWQAIIFTLTGDPFGDAPEDILSRVVPLTSPPVNNENLGYGPATYLNPEEVTEVYKAIRNITQEDLRAKFDIKEMCEQSVYPIYDDENEDQFFNYVWSKFEGLKEFYSTASTENQYVLFFIG